MSARLILADNVQVLMDSYFAHSSNRPLDLSKAAKVSLSSVQRVLGAETGATVDTIGKLARVFDLEPYQLLVPELNPRAPQTVPPARPRLYSVGK